MDTAHRSEHDDRGTHQRVVDARSEAAAAIRDERAHSPEGGPAVVSCKGCGAIVSLTDSECWRCARYFPASEFDDQR